ncbi:MAG: helix-turn-helix domain-containing protein [Solirubrobacterales bacterium]
MAARSKELQALGQAIREARKKLGISQERLALEAGLDRTFISSIEAGRRNITFASLLKVARALDLKPIEILRRWEQLTK